MLIERVQIAMAAKKSCSYGGFILLGTHYFLELKTIAIIFVGIIKIPRRVNQ
jgi:hypothetical protein